MNPENVTRKNKNFYLLFILGTLFYAFAVILDSILKIVITYPLGMYKLLAYQCVDIVFNCILIFGLITLYLYLSEKSKKLYTPFILYIGLVGNIVVLGFEAAFYLKNNAVANGIICIINSVIKAIILLFFIYKNVNNANESGTSKFKIALIVSISLSFTFIAAVTVIDILYVYAYLCLTPLIAMMTSFLGNGFEAFADALSINLHIKNLLVCIPYFVSHLLYLAYMFSTLRKDSKKSPGDKFVFKVI